MTDQLLDVPGARLVYSVQEGDGPPVVALHGLLSSRAAEDAGGFFGWSEVAAVGVPLVRYDARGHGRSTGRAVPEDYRWPLLADDLIALLDAVAGDGPVDAVGTSMGVGTLLHAVARAPGRFRRLVLVLPPTAWSTRPAQRQVYESGAAFVEQRGAEAFARGLAAMPTLPILEEGGWAQAAPDVQEDLLPSVLRGAGASDLPTEVAIAAVEQDVLLLPWTDDPGHPVSTAERLSGLLPHARLEVIRTAADLRAAGGRAAAFLTA